MATVELTLDVIHDAFDDTLASRIVAVKHIAKGGFGSVAELTTVDGTIFVGKLISVPPHSQCEPTCTESTLLRECGGSVWFVKVFESHLSMDKKLWLILMEPCVRSLAQHFQLKKRIDEQDLKPLAAQLILAVNHMHSRNIIHHDIKPANVLLGRDGLLKLAGFSIARRSSVKAGTRGHMAPEVIEGKRHGSRADIWSLGVVLYLLAAGRLPFASDEEACELPLTFPPQFPDDLRRLLCRMLCKDPAQRMPIEEVIASEYFAKALDSLKKLVLARQSPISEHMRPNVVREIKDVLLTISGRILYKGWVSKPNGDPRYMVLTEHFIGTSPKRLDPKRGDRPWYGNAQPIAAVRFASTVDKDSFVVVLNGRNGEPVEHHVTCAQASCWAAAINSAIEKQMMKTEK